MEYANPIVRGTFVRRLNRFAAEAVIGGETQLVHVKNTGRLKQLLVPGAEVWLEAASQPARKTQYSLISVRSKDIIVNIDSQAPAAVVEEALRAGKVKEIGHVRFLKREAAYGGSRFDFYYEADGRKGYIEVKGVTLANGDTALFPDAPTARGTKHVLELAEAVERGYEGAVLFLVQMKGCRRFKPHAEMDKAFAEALEQAARRGVRVLAYDSEVTESAIVFGEPLEVAIR
ncbi:MAG TPA: DNA/RNA nuclease SfsA [Paenibacillaceae bacterium]